MGREAGGGVRDWAGVRDLGFVCLLGLGPDRVDGLNAYVLGSSVNRPRNRNRAEYFGS